MISKILTCSSIPSSYYFLLTLGAIKEDKEGETNTKEIIISKEKLIGAAKILIQELDKMNINEVAFEVDLKFSYKYNDLEKELNEFLTTYKNFVYERDGNIILREEIDLDIIIEELGKIEEFYKFDSFFFEVRILRKKKAFKDYLNLNHIKNLYHELILIESEVESLYIELENNTNSKEIKDQIGKLLLNRNKIYKKLYKVGLYLIKAIQDEENRVKIDYKENYQIDFDLLLKSKYYNMEYDDELEEIGIPLENNFLSIFQIAIFGNIPLAEPKLSNDLNQLLCDVANDEKEFETISYYENEVFKGSFDMNFATCFDSDIIFYLIYIKKLDLLIEIYGNNLELLKVKTRLIYALDDITLSLYKEENRDIVLEEKLKSPDIDVVFFDNYDHFKEESLFFIEDIFEGSRGGYTDILKKLAFVATYYELTKDNEVKTKLLDYTSFDHYFEYYKFIINFNSKKLIK